MKVLMNMPLVKLCVKSGNGTGIKRKLSNIWYKYDGKEDQRQRDLLLNLRSVLFSVFRASGCLILISG